jgi:hypothetical protein
MGTVMVITVLWIVLERVVRVEVGVERVVREVRVVERVARVVEVEVEVEVEVSFSVWKCIVVHCVV